MTTHTPGPWVWIEGTDAINRRWNNLDWTVASVGNHRLGWHEDKNSEAQEAGANARLIAAAPELLEMLQRALIYSDGILRANAHADGEVVDFETFSEWRALIAKATGTAP